MVSYFTGRIDFSLPNVPAKTGIPKASSHQILLVVIKVSSQGRKGFSYIEAKENACSPPFTTGPYLYGKLYQVLTSYFFVAMGSGVNLTDDLGGLAGGTAALALAVLPKSPDLAIFGASMSGSCIGFLVHNRYRASIFMGDTGSLALDGALAAMAACA
ncbi:phospho-N-acetylmuramoyl-pentapeptide-transferase homolog [Papaver somniferum]|uniref:phospho-N-acetylmuramoyl-pentapeptide- transferase homolog n=1 Tax=Papaver somniferum TaxID=3469 RepID=UPI000E70034D|nr:phospho-N-acetylmuramoyl-pentapeptide-transferase homolog [Papaver somniferum]